MSNSNTGSLDRFDLDVDLGLELLDMMPLVPIDHKCKQIVDLCSLLFDGRLAGRILSTKYGCPQL